jgi:O-antigen ligase
MVNRWPNFLQLSIFGGIALLAAFIGLVVPIYAEVFGASTSRLAALPAVLFLGLLLLLSRKGLFLLIILTRASGDLVFESTKFSIAGVPIGVGGAVNALVILLALILVMERPKVLSSRVCAPWVAFIVMLVCSAAISPNKGDALRQVLAQCSYFAVFISAFYVVRVPDDFKFCTRLVLWSSIPPALYALSDIALHARGLGSLRIHSTFAHPNILAFYLTMVIPLVLYTVKSAGPALSGPKRFVLMTYMLYLIGLLLLTQTRSAWVACFAVFAVYGLFFERRYLVYLVSAAGLALLMPSVQDRIMDLATGNQYIQWGDLNSFAWRQLLWRSALEWMEPIRYFFGYGLESFKFYSLVFFPLAGRTMWGAHSVYVELLFEMGIIGLLAYLWLFYRLYSAARLLASIDKLGAFVCIAVILQYLIISLSDNMLDYLAFNWYVFFLVGAAFAAVKARDTAAADKQAAPLPSTGYSEKKTAVALST